MITYSNLGNYGNLGNQMFQYAAAKSAALNSSSIFAIPFENQKLTNYFNLDTKFYSLKQTAHLINKLKKYDEKNFNYDKRYESIEDNTDLIGYFQTEKYFKKYVDIIKKDFSFNENIKNLCNEKIKYFKQDKNLVSVHIRRTDYVNLQNFHPLCSLEYYKNAMDFFKNSLFLIFSDDIDWCKKNIAYDNNVFIENQNPGEDLCLMSLCDHNIIANSSFSWWAAWLNNNKNKQIIAPKIWFGEGYSDKNTDDLYCEDWIKI